MPRLFNAFYIGTEYSNRTVLCTPHTHTHSKFRLLASLFLGQILSLLLCGTGVLSQMLETNHSITVPTTQSFLNYVLLGAVFGVPLAVRKDFIAVLRQNWWKYIILGAIDVEANYMVVRAYEFTNLTTIQVYLYCIYRIVIHCSIVVSLCVLLLEQSLSIYASAVCFCTKHVYTCYTHASDT